MKKSKSRPKDAKEASSRDRLLAVAKRLFAEHGFDGVSVRDLVQAADANVSLVSYYFGGKEELYRECLSQFGTRNLDFAKETLVAAKDASEFRVRLFIYMERMISFNLADLDMHRIVDREVERNSQLFRDLLMNIYVEVFRTVVRFFEAAVKAGFCRKGTDPVVMATMVQGFMRQELRIEPRRKELLGKSIYDAVHRQHVVESFANVVMHGILPPSGE